MVQTLLPVPRWNEEQNRKGCYSAQEKHKPTRILASPYHRDPKGTSSIHEAPTCCEAVVLDDVPSVSQPISTLEPFLELTVSVG